MFIDPDFPVGNAAGGCKTLEEVRQLARSAASFIVVGSFTVEPRSGNPGNTFNGDPVYGLNSRGLPNPGVEWLKKEGPKMVAIAHAAGKPIILSVAGFNPSEYELLVLAAVVIGFDGVELNFGCSNIVDGGTRHRIITYDVAMVRAILLQIYMNHRIVPEFVSVKVSPILDLEYAHVLADVFRRFPITALVTMNAIPNCLDFGADGLPVIQTPDKTGYAGGSGTQVRQMALGQAHMWRSVLPEKEKWGVGGMGTGPDVKKMLRVASVVQIGTAYLIYGPKIFGGIAAEYLDVE